MRYLTSLSVYCYLIAVAMGSSTINVMNKYGYGANVGWLNFNTDGNNGVVIGEFVCSGYIWGANVGWINLGNGNPANDIQYQNTSDSDFGVNNDGGGNLSGFAYGANIGWINFEQTYGKPHIDLATGRLVGFIWSANCGWISLSNTTAFVQTDIIQMGLVAPNGLPVAWLLLNFGTTNISANADPSGKGQSIKLDYLAGTDPNNSQSVLKITSKTFLSDGSSVSLKWNSVPTRFYFLEKATNIAKSYWVDSGLGMISPSAGSSTFGSFADSKSPVRYYRIKAVRPLMP